MIDKPELPEGAIVNAHVSVVQFLDPEDGELKFGISYSGDVPLTQMLGLLELSKLEMLKEARDW